MRFFTVCALVFALCLGTHTHSGAQTSKKTAPAQKKPAASPNTEAASKKQPSTEKASTPKSETGATPASASNSKPKQPQVSNNQGTSGNSDYYFYGPYPTQVHFTKGALFGQVGLGLLAFHTYSGSSTSVPPLFVAGEYGVTDRIGAGGILGYTSSKYSYGNGFGSWSYRFSYLIIAARGTYHFYQDPKWDTYGGLLLGYNIATARYTGTNNPFFDNTISADGGAISGIFVGARYFINPRVAILGEFGYQLALLNLGVSVKLK